MIKSVTLAVALAASNPALAGVCDHRPSESVAALGGAIAGGAAVAANTAMSAAGFYSITHATTGAAMLGSTAAGSSAAGTTGIIAGSAGVAGTVGAVALSPITLAAGAAAVVGAGAYEGLCWWWGG